MLLLQREYFKRIKSMSLQTLGLVVIEHNERVPLVSRSEKRAFSCCKTAVCVVCCEPVGPWRGILYPFCNPQKFQPEYYRGVAEGEPILNALQIHFHTPSLNRAIISLVPSHLVLDPGNQTLAQEGSVACWTGRTYSLVLACSLRASCAIALPKRHRRRV